MDILNVLKQLRDDIKLWTTNNLTALNSKIDEKTIPIDSELSATSTNPVQNKAIAKELDTLVKELNDLSREISNKSNFSGDYNDLTNAPNISEDDSGNMVIADESGNIIFKVDADGIHTTAVSLDGEAAATKKYVDDAVANIPTPDVSGQINTHNVSEEAHADIRQAIEDAKEELGESIVAESDEWKVVDETGNIIFSVDASGAHTTELTLNGESAATKKYVEDAIANIKVPTTDLTGYATEQWVENKNYLTEHQDISGKSDVGHKHVIGDITDLPDYATKDYVDTSVADLVNSAPEALNTLGELAEALETHEDAYDALLETVGNKASKTELEDVKSELSESIESESEAFEIVDDKGNIITSIDNEGITTTKVATDVLLLDGEDVAGQIDKCISYEEQQLTEEQKKVARENIGTISVEISETPKDGEILVYDATANKLVNSGYTFETLFDKMYKIIDDYMNTSITNEPNDAGGITQSVEAPAEAIATSVNEAGGETLNIGG